MDDVRAVMDAIGSQRAALFGNSEGCAMSALFAATYPERVSRLILFGGYAHRRDLSGKQEERALQRATLWGTGAMIKTVAPSAAANPEAVAQFGKFERLSASPGAAKSFSLLNAQIDVSLILPTVRVPTLVVHRGTDVQVPVERGRELASLIPDAKFIEYPDGDHGLIRGDVDALLGDVEEFITGHRDGSSDDLERVLATVLFTDIVDSTRSAAAKGDHAWRRLLDSHDQLALQLVERHRGTLTSQPATAFGDFDGPGRTVRCALAPGGLANWLPLRRLPARRGLPPWRRHRRIIMGGPSVAALSRLEKAQVRRWLNRQPAQAGHVDFARAQQRSARRRLGTFQGAMSG
jgi:hypothetical protein